MSLQNYNARHDDVYRSHGQYFHNTSSPKTCTDSSQTHPIDTAAPHTAITAQIVITTPGTTSTPPTADTTPDMLGAGLPPGTSRPTPVA